MTQEDKLIQKLRGLPKDFRWNELTKLLSCLGFIELTNNKTGGSRRKFFHKERNLIINLHQPHPSPSLKSYAIKQVYDKLKEEGLL